ncbi:MAG: M56 family metallopeptidase [Pirellulales bacterium]
MSNGVAATLLALAAALVTRWCRRPQVVLVLWLLVLAKLLAPPIVGLPAVSLRAYLPQPALRMLSPPDEADLPLDDWAASMPQLSETLVPLPEMDAPADVPIEFYVPSNVDLAALPALEPVDEPVAVDGALADDEKLSVAEELPLVALQLPTLGKVVEPSLRYDWLPRAIGWTWLGGSALWFVIAALRIARFARLLRHAEPAGSALTAEVRALSAQMGLARVPDVRLSRRRVPPLVWGMSGRPTLLLPAELLESLSHQQRATLLAHELAHVARRDDLVRWFELAAIGLYWWHPVAWWARYNAEAAQEQCCDARVLALLPHAARAYAETLLATIEFLAEPVRTVPLGASGFSQVGHMHRRLTMILKRNPSGRLTWPATAALAAISLLVLPVSLDTLWAEPVAEDDVEVTVEAEIAEPIEAEEVKEAIEAVEPGALEAEIEVEVAADVVAEVEVEEAKEPADPVEAEEPADAVDPAIERRLERLEKMIEAMARGRSSATIRKSPTVSKRTESESRPDRSHDAHEMENLQQEIRRSFELAHNEVSKQMARAELKRDRVRQATDHVKMLLQSERFGGGSVDVALEALRARYAEQLQYNQSIAPMAAVFSREQRSDLLVTKANLAAAEQARRDTVMLLEKLAEHGAAPDDIANTKRLLHSFEDSVKRFAAGVDRWRSLTTAASSGRGEGQKFRIARSHDAAHAEARVDDELNRAIRELEMVNKLKHSDVIKAHVYARAKNLEDQEKHFRAQLELAQKSLGDLEAKKAAIEKELAVESARLNQRQDEVKAIYKMKRAMLEKMAKENLDAKQQKVKEQADEELKAVEKMLRQKSEKAAEEEHKESAEEKQLEKSLQDKQQGAKASVFREWELDKMIPIGERRNANAAGKEPVVPGSPDGALRGNRPLTPYVKVSYANLLLADARDAWKQTYQRHQSPVQAGESQEEAVAREHYFQLKGVVGRLLADDYDVPATSVRGS